MNSWSVRGLGAAIAAILVLGAASCSGEGDPSDATQPLGGQAGSPGALAGMSGAVGVAGSAAGSPTTPAAQGGQGGSGGAGAGGDTAMGGTGGAVQTGGGGAGTSQAGAGGTPSDAPNEDFTIVAVPDTQFFVQRYKGGVPEMFTAQFQWIRDNLDTWNIKFVSHLGDIVEQYPDGYGADVQVNQWDVAVSAFDIIHGHVPYGMTPGNHDCSNWQGAADDWGNYHNNFPVSRFDGMDWYGGNLNGNLNSYQLFSAGGMEFIAVHLRYAPTAEERAWAGQILDQHSFRRAIVVSHEIESAGFLSGPGPGIWDEVVRSRDNVFMMLSGHHCARESTSTLTNDQGNAVYSIMSDYQCDDPQPVNLRLYTFKPLMNQIEVKTYSPWNDAYETDADSEFTLPYTMTE